MSNVLVSQGRVRVLDFGLAITHTQARRGDEAGSLLYMPPELQDGVAHSEAADLYTMGILIYEMLVGCHPFYSADLQEFLDRLWRSKPDLTPLVSLTAPDALVTLPAVLERLLARQPAARYATAEAAVADLCSALGHPLPRENSAIRESFLQAATFVGRKQEMAQLTVALANMLQGQGSAWLIGGESGVGKSRLLDEVRIQALVTGALVLRGQAVEGGGLPYQLWREPLRQLVLGGHLSDLEASILKPLVPDIAHLLQRPIVEVAELQGPANQQRLLLTIVELFKHQREPLVLLLEDLQWTTESLEVLKWLLRQHEQLPLLVLATYRDDERPELPTELPGVRQLKLARLSDQAVAALSRAMLGEAGKQPQVVELLQRESEGNTYFMIEVVRALAEEAGQLSAIGRKSLPQRIGAGGVQQVLRRRLARVPTWALPALKVAAVAGRQLNQALLTQACTGVTALTGEGWREPDWESWLTVCANAAVLEVADGQWRFAHDKLRESLLADLTTAELPLLHRWVAQAIEILYPTELAYAEMLADHWANAGEMHKALAYLIQAIEYLVMIAAEYERAERLILRGLAYQDAPYRALFYYWWGELKNFQSAYPTAITHFQTSMTLWAPTDPGRAAILNGLCQAHWRQGNYRDAHAYVQEAWQVAQAEADQRGMALSLSNLGILADLQGQQRQAIAYYQKSLPLWEALKSPRYVARTYMWLGLAYNKQQHFADAEAAYEASLQMHRAIGDRNGVATTLLNMSIMANATGRYGQAQQWATESLQMTKATRDRVGEARALLWLGVAFTQLNALAIAHTHLVESLAIFGQIGDRVGSATVERALGDVEYRRQAYQSAYQHLTKALEIWQSVGDQVGAALTQADLALVWLSLGDKQQAQAAIAAALQRATTQTEMVDVNYLLVIAAAVLHTMGEDELAAQWIGGIPALTTPSGSAHKVLQRLLKQLAMKLGNEQFQAAVAYGKTLEIMIMLRTAHARFAALPAFAGLS